MNNNTYKPLWLVQTSEYKYYVEAETYQEVLALLGDLKDDYEPIKSLEIKKIAEQLIRERD